MDEENHTYVVAKTTTILVGFKISCTTLYQGMERGIGRSEVAEFAAYESAYTVIVGGERNSVDFAMVTETAQMNESVNFVDDVDMTTCDDTERIANSPAGHLDYLQR